MTEDTLRVESTGETVGEAKWAALRELEKLHPGLDKSAVRFQVVSEGERGLLGVGYAPARVIATAPAPPAAEARDESEEAALVRELLPVQLGAEVKAEPRLLHDLDTFVPVIALPLLEPPA